MSREKVYLNSFNVKNVLSLRNVTLPLRPLTVLVGPNASGKTNVITALEMFQLMVQAENPLPLETPQMLFWAGQSNHMSFHMKFKLDETHADYKLEIEAHADQRVYSEDLKVNNVEVIATKGGQGDVYDEDGRNRTSYRSNRVALTSAGDYGEKPVTSALTEFIGGWKFYDFLPRFMRRKWTRARNLPGSPQLDDEGKALVSLLTYWNENDRARFERVSESLAHSTNISIAQSTIDGDEQLCLLEGYENPIPLHGASDGTLRLIAYYILLNEPQLPPLIAIEEPERNLHPGALTTIADVIERIAEQSQVIITTHSSQLLDAFAPENLSESLGVLLLRNRSGQGTEVFDLEKVRNDRRALEGWIADFGIGSGIFESELLQDLMEEPVCLV